MLRLVVRRGVVATVWGLACGCCDTEAALRLSEAMERTTRSSIEE